MDAKELSIALRGCFDIDERGRGIWESEKAESLISSALSAQAAEVERQGWIDIKDKLPPNGDPVLCSGLDWGKGPSRHYEVASFDGRQFYRGREEGEISDLDECPYITHWMPLPEAPTALPPDAPEAANGTR